MTRLIDADAFADDLEYDVELCARALDDMNMVGKERDDMQFEKDCKQNCIWYISEQPTVDAVPVRHGKWIRNDNGTYSCSVCQSWIPEQQHYYARYCLHCGARMDEDNVEQTKKKISQTL